MRKEEETVEKGKFVLIQPASKDSTELVKPAVKVEYKGPYSQKTSSTYCYSLIFLKKQNDEAKLIKAFESFNQANFGAASIKVSVESLDDNRGILVVNGLGEKGSATAYLQKSVSDPSLNALIGGNNFRKFIITSENLVIFKKEKNLIQYMEFFNQVK